MDKKLIDALERYDLANEYDEYSAEDWGTDAKYTGRKKKKYEHRAKRKRSVRKVANQVKDRYYE